MTALSSTSTSTSSSTFSSRSNGAPPEKTAAATGTGTGTELAGFLRRELGGDCERIPYLADVIGRARVDVDLTVSDEEGEGGGRGGYGQRYSHLAPGRRGNGRVPVNNLVNRHESSRMRGPNDLIGAATAAVGPVPRPGTDSGHGQQQRVWKFHNYTVVGPIFNSPVASSSSGPYDSPYSNVSPDLSRSLQSVHASSRIGASAQLGEEGSKNAQAPLRSAPHLKLLPPLRSGSDNRSSHVPVIVVDPPSEDETPPATSSGRNQASGSTHLELPALHHSRSNSSPPSPMIVIEAPVDETQPVTLSGGKLDRPVSGPPPPEKLPPIEIWRKKMATGMIDKLCFQKQEWWTETKYNWYPFIRCDKWTHAVTDAPCSSTHADPEALLMDYATQIFRKRRSGRITQGELFLLVCLCQVVKYDVHITKMVKVVKMCVPSMKRQTLVDYLGGIAWVGKVMRKLSQFGWDTRFIDFLVACE